jgi:hypothetical protein
MPQAVIPFDEIVAGASARLAVIEDTPHLSVRDVLMHICSLSANSATYKFRSLPEEAKAELRADLAEFQFPGRGNKMEPVITFKGALKLVMLVSGQRAALYRSAMAKILQRYYAGDGSLVEEVAENAQSSGPVQQMARASLAAEADPEMDALELPFKKRRLELQLAREEAALVSIQHDNDAKRIANQAAEHDSDAKKIANQAAEHENEARRLANAMTKRDYVSDVAEKYRDLCGDTVMDERARLMLKDNFLNMAAHEGGKALIADGSSQPISLSLVADEMKVKLSSGELISLGQEVRRRYVEAHGRPPSKHEQLCGGRVTLVNSYFAADKPMIEAVLRAHVEGSA